MECKYTFRDRHELYQMMKEPTRDQSLYIFSVLKKNKEAYTENSNGIFFDVNTLSDETLCCLIVYFKEHQSRTL